MVSFYKVVISICSKKQSNKSHISKDISQSYNLSGNGLVWKNDKTGGDWFMIDESWDKMSQSQYVKFTTDWMKASHRVLKNRGSIYVACSYHNIAEVMMTLKELDYKINNVITWYKTNAMPNMTKRTFTHSTEFVVWATKGAHWKFNYDVMKKINPNKQLNGNLKQMRDLWKMPLVQGKERLKNGDGRALHPTQKPEEMLKRIILASSDKGDIVLDPFVGSGTTAVVAKTYGRDFIGIDKEEKYITATRTRLDLISTKQNIPLR
ncbi:MAG: site-specific DNA-methyltransferase [Flavobacteriaceae bacterium]|nr:site-specific DNA-methyltransferase [Flavobacteriaceae bacterium]